MRVVHPLSVVIQPSSFLSRTAGYILRSNLDWHAARRFGHVGCLYERLLSAPGESWQHFFPCDGQAPSDAELVEFSANSRLPHPSAHKLTNRSLKCSKNSQEHRL